VRVVAGSTDVTTYFSLRLAADGTEATGLTITDIDLQYVRSGATPAAKVDATALGAANSAHSDNAAIEIDATDQPGLLRVDWPDAAFATGVREVVLSVKYPGCFTEHLRVELVGGLDFEPVDAMRPAWSISGTTLTVKKPDGSTTAHTKTLTTVPDASADDITGSA
jgi:hypothetical protein